MTIFIDQLSYALTQTLPGTAAQARLSPALRFPADMPLPDADKARHSAVLLFLYPHQTTWHIALMQRSADSHIHSGQISFPGGGVEPTDTDRVHTALRETHEEFGFDTADVVVVGKLTPLYIPVSNSWVQPVVGYCTYRPTFTPDAREVAAILEIPLHELSKPHTVTTALVQSGMQFTVRVPCFAVQGHIIWGATAMILSEFLAVASTIAPTNEPA